MDLVKNSFKPLFRKPDFSRGRTSNYSTCFLPASQRLSLILVFVVGVGIFHHPTSRLLGNLFRQLKLFLIVTLVKLAKIEKKIELLTLYAHLLHLYAIAIQNISLIVLFYIRTRKGLEFC